MKHIVVIGSKGMLGVAVTAFMKQNGRNVLPISRAEFDIANDPIEHLEPLLHDAKAVINCAGVIKPRISAMTPEDVLKVNALFPRNLATVCKGKGLPCIHVTTDCVYSGRRGAYTENDTFDADDFYGLSKIAGENTNCMVLRTSIIGEEEGRSRSLLEWARSQRGKEVSGFTNHLWNGVTTVCLAEVIDTILHQHLYLEGTYHIHSPNTVTKEELLHVFDRVYDLSLTIKPAEAPVRCDRSLASNYSLAQRLCQRSIEEQTEAMKQFFEKTRASNDCREAA